MAGGVLGFIVTLGYPAFRFLRPAKNASASVGAVKVAKVSELKPNSSRIFRYGSRLGILIRTIGGEFRAFDAECTHLSCTVQFRPDTERIWCACHNGYFDLRGRNVSGPPPAPLRPLNVSLRGEEVFVSPKKNV